MAYGYLAVAIIAEVIGTAALKASDGFSHSLASVICILGYGTAFYCLSLVLKTLPVGITYAIWSGLGIVLIAIVSAVLFKQIPDWPAIIGMALIMSGVIIINVYSNTSGH